MSTVEFDLLSAFEVHSLGDIRAILDAGFDVGSAIKGKSVINSLTEMYTRSNKFPDCLRLLLERGAVLDDPRIGPVLLNDADGLAAALHRDPSLIEHRTSMVSAFTPLVGASLLHVAAEFGNVEATRVLIEMGADVNARAAFDESGLNGHTPIFHTVNSNDNRSAPLLTLLLDAGAQPDVRLQGITWGKGFEWETTCFDVTPISYTQLGLLPQMHRRERDIYANIKQLLEASARLVPPLDNVPNRYLKSGVSNRKDR
jgi:ankyrin repeat protein